MPITIEDTSLYTVIETAQALEVGEQTVRNWIKLGKLRSQKVGKAYFITEGDIIAFLKGENTPTSINITLQK